MALGFVDLEKAFDTHRDGDSDATVDGLTTFFSLLESKITSKLPEKVKLLYKSYLSKITSRNVASIIYFFRIVIKSIIYIQTIINKHHGLILIKM